MSADDLQGKGVRFLDDLSVEERDFVKHICEYLEPRPTLSPIVPLKWIECGVYHWGYIGNNGKENGSYCSIIGCIWYMGILLYYTQSHILPT